jgi:glycosyltransferase involved in cell wall biosynthesis
MLFSVLVALYNNARFLEACIKSVYAQTYQNWELIIVDDGSTDNVNDVLLPYRHDARIRVYRNTENRGCAFTKHRLATLVQGELAAFLDPDDALTTTFAMKTWRFFVSRRNRKPFPTMYPTFC